jgi:putative salt-induced outer membrane protein YdiY
MRITRTCMLLSLVLVPLAASAQTPAAPAAPPPPPRHEGSAEAAFVGITGNTSNLTFGAGGEYIYRPDKMLIRNKATYIRTDESGVTTALAIAYTGRVERALNARASVYGDYAYFRDTFSGILNRNAITGGVSIKAVNGKSQTLAVDLGGGYLNEERTTGPAVSTGVYSLGWSYRLKITATSDLSDDFTYTGTFASASDWRIFHSIALTAKISTILSLKVANTIRFANVPVPTFLATDTTTTISLVAKFPGKK